MEEKDSTQVMNNSSNRKSDYRSPVLVCFGRVREITQGGSGNANEGSNCSGSANACKRAVSDPRSKENILRIGTHPLGIGLYLFDYKSEFKARWGRDRQFGVMADEVETVMPEAVGEHADGYKMVDYAMLGVEHPIL